MASLGTTVDPNVVPPEDPSRFDVIPAGTVAPAHVIESKVGPTSKPGGLKAELTWEILDGPFKNRKIWDNINIKNANPKAAEIGQRHLSAIAVATGVGAITDTNQVHFKPCIVKIGVEKGTGNYKDKNTIQGVKAYSAANMAAPAAATQAAPAPAAQTWQQPAAPARPATPQPGSVPWGQGNTAPF